MDKLIEYIKNLVFGFWYLLQGLYVSMKNFCRKKVTEQYPENRDNHPGFERFRAQLTMPHDEENHHKCTACGLCHINCPNGSIQVITKMVTDEETGKSRKVLDKYLYNVGSCIFCEICTRVCPQDAIEWSNNFEHSVFTRSKLEYRLDREGSSLKPKKTE